MYRRYDSYPAPSVIEVFPQETRTEKEKRHDCNKDDFRKHVRIPEPCTREIPPHTHAKPHTTEKKSFSEPLGFLPEAIYNHKTKKFFNVLSAEEILLLGLILLLLEDSEKNLMLVLALAFIFISGNEMFEGMLKNLPI